MTRELLPTRRAAEVVEFVHNNRLWRLMFGRFADGRPAELFLDGGTVDPVSELAKESAIVASLALQSGRDTVMALVAAGDLRVCEAADLLGVTDRSVWRWCKAAGVQPKQARAALLARLSKVAHLFAPAFDQMMRDRT